MVYNRIRLDEESVLARFAEWHTRIKKRPVAALGQETRNAMLFVEDEVIIDGRDHLLADELMARYGAKVIPESPLPPPPQGLPRKQIIKQDNMPKSIRLRFAVPPPIDDVMGLLEQAMNNGDGGNQDDIIITSNMGASVAAVVAHYALEGRPIGLNLFGKTSAMPLSSAKEGPIPDVGDNPFEWQAFAGRSRVVDAWQLVDSIRQILRDHSRFTTIGILDTGFWLDNNGMPMVSDLQSESDFGTSVMWVNLIDKQPAGGMNPKPDEHPWHGNCVASVATAAVANSAGAAGSGGTVAKPVLFKHDFSLDQILLCVRLCAYWRIDVLNMSFHIEALWDLLFPTSLWNDMFQWAFDNRVVMIAAAANELLNLPHDKKIRPATRTPGVLTIGALDQTDNAWIDEEEPGIGSNYGSSVWLWAPGVRIPVAPNPQSPNGERVTGTSVAAPIVSGVAAMMRFANEGLSAADIIRILVDTGWNGTGRVSKGLDAFAAVLTAINHTLPDTDEPNNTPATARDLVPSGLGRTLAPNPSTLTARSSSADADYWKFHLVSFSTVTVTVDWYERISSLHVALETDDTEGRGINEMTKFGGSNSGRIMITGFLPPGTYRVRVFGSGVTAYRLQVSRKPAPLPKDIFEDNDSFDQAAHLFFESTNLMPYYLLKWGPGTYDATLHKVGATGVNDDYFLLEAQTSDKIFLRRHVSVYDTDEKVNVTLYDESHAIIKNWLGVRSMSTFLPGQAKCFLKVSGNESTRYCIAIKMMVDSHLLPGPLQEELVEIIPKWWFNPSPLVIRSIVTHYAIDVKENRGDGEAIVFKQPDEPVRIELLNQSGQIISEGVKSNENLFIDTRGIERGMYVMRISRVGNTANPSVHLHLVPPLW